MTECQHEWTEPQPGTITETGETVTAQQCLQCHTWLIQHDTATLTTRWPITIELAGSTLIAPGPHPEQP